MDLMNAIRSCLCGSTDVATLPLRLTGPSIIDKKPSFDSLPPHATKPAIYTAEEIAANVVTILRCAEKQGPVLAKQVDDTVGAEGWTEWLAENILKSLEIALKEGREKMGPALAQAYSSAVEIAEEEFYDLFEYVKDHPLEVAATVVISILAFGVLVALMPWVLELLGFGELGPIEGEIQLSFQ